MQDNSQSAGYSLQQIADRVRVIVLQINRTVPGLNNGATSLCAWCNPRSALQIGVQRAALKPILIRHNLAFDAPGLP